MDAYVQNCGTHLALAIAASLSVCVLSGQFCKRLAVRLETNTDELVTLHTLREGLAASKSISDSVYTGGNWLLLNGACVCLLHLEHQGPVSTSSMYS